MIYFVGAGPGAVDLITVRGQKLLEEADLIIYAGSLVNPQLLQFAKKGCHICNSASMTLEDVLREMEQAEKKGWMTVRLHTGDPCLYGAIREQMDALDQRHIAYTYVPGVSSFSAAAAAVRKEYTLPGISQSVIITRMEGRTPVPDGQRIADYAAHHATMVIFLSTGLLDKLQTELRSLNSSVADTQRIRRQLSYTRHPGRMNGSFTALSRLWQKRQRLPALPGRHSSWSAISSMAPMTGVSYMTRPLPMDTAKRPNSSCERR